MTQLRSDAARSRTRILETARGRDVDALRLNDLAREAGVGVGTVYRHFPTVQSLIEALAADSLQRLRDLAREAEAEPDPARALEGLVRGAVALQLEDDGLRAVLLADDAGDETRAARREVFARFATILDHARRAGVVRPGLTSARLQHLVCGLEYAVRIGSTDDRDFYIDVALAGLRADAASE
ncbi:TetR/AcrR family transcriptional regulator [Agromyces larvae]|uniref:TetR/AcrR family transcriptional regulator n=1 Tax=Agromyces larvae TaxID=2929802 RepID=A0ABY4C1N1_9MICO|nr:TetR family transcriptional regulator [Agromyces larvae]UOE42685.1 TetR/AcrR family transcriptional regulator [Agromyces larvae]